MKYIILILLLPCVMYSQQGKIQAGALMVRVTNASDTLWLAVDTLGLRTSDVRRIDSMATANGYGAGGGDSVSVSDVTNFAGSITGDTANGHWILHYSIYNTQYSQGGTTSFSNQATDSTTIVIGSAGGSGLLLCEAGTWLERFQLYTNTNDNELATFDAHTPIGVDSLLISFHIVNRAGVTYISVFKHPTNTSLLSIGVTTAGTMIIQQAITVTGFRTGTTIQFRMAVFMTRRVR